MTTESDDDSDAFQESFQELPTFPKATAGGSVGSRDHSLPPPQPPRVGFTLPPEERRGVGAASADSTDNGNLSRRGQDSSAGGKNLSSKGQTI